MKIREDVTKEKKYIVEMRRFFHQHPEVSLEEFKTCTRIEEELDAMDIPHRRVGGTGVFGWIDGKKQGQGKNIALRADIDALAMEDIKTVTYASQNKGFCHACGHDGHIATLLGAAKVLKAKENEFSGQVKLFFQQAEEIGQGARIFVEEGLVDNCARVFGAHVASRLEVGKVAITQGPQCASCDYFKINITGKGAHVSTPHLGIDATYIAAQIVVNLQSIVARSTAPLETVVVGVGVVRSGTQYNIVAEHSELEGTTRSFLPEIRQYTNQRVVDIAKQTALMYGAIAEVTFLDYAAPLVNHSEAVEELTKIAESFLSSSNIVKDYEKALGADDFADYLGKVKGVYAFIGTQNKKKANTCVAHHHGLFDIEEDALLISCNLYVEYALEIAK